MFLKPFDNIYASLDLVYPWAKLTGFAPFTRTKTDDGRYRYAEASNFKYVIGIGVILINLWGAVVIAHSKLQKSQGGYIEAVVIIITLINACVGNAVTTIYVAYKIRNMFKILDLINCIDQKLISMGISVGYASLYRYRLFTVFMFLIIWMSNIIYYVFYGKSVYAIVTEIVAYGTNLHNQCVCVIYFLFFNRALAQRLVWLQEKIKKMIRSELSATCVEQFIDDVSDLCQKIQRTSNYNSDTFLISVMILYSSTNFMILIAILKVNVIGATDGAAQSFILGGFYNLLLISIVTSLELVKYRYKATIRKLDILVTLRLKSVSALRKKNIFLLQGLHAELKFSPLGLFDMTFQKLLEGYGSLASIVMFLTQIKNLQEPN